MKNIKYNIILIATVLATTVANATVRTLNNNNPSPGQYTTWAGVQSASAAGDTVYVSGSPISYGTITVTVYNLCIIGSGHNPQKQNPLVSEFGDIIGTVAQMRIDGVKCSGVLLFPTLGVAQLFLNNSYVKNVIEIAPSTGFDAYLYLTNNVVNRPNYTSGGTDAAAIVAYTNSGSSLHGIIHNNFFGGSISLNSSGAGIEQCNITNNIFSSNGFGFSTLKLFEHPIVFSNSIFSNNILLRFQTHNLAVGSTVICENNLTYPVAISPALPNSSGTLIANPLFVNYSCPTWDCDFSNAYDLHLQAGSPGKNAGTDGTDIGPYGGPYGATFTTYGEPSIPQMKQMNMPATVPSGGSFNVNIISTVK